MQAITNFKKAAKKAESKSTNIITEKKKANGRIAKSQLIETNVQGRSYSSLQTLKVKYVNFRRTVNAETAI